MLIPRKCSSARRVVQNKPSALIHREENKVEYLARQFLSEKLSLVHKKESEHSFGLSLSTCVFYRRIFNLEMRNFSFVDGWRLLRCQIRWLLPHSRCGCPFDFCKGGGVFFLLEISLPGTFFWNHPQPPQKSNCWPLNPPNIGSVDRPNFLGWIIYHFLLSMELHALHARGGSANNCGCPAVQRY